MLYFVYMLLDKRTKKISLINRDFVNLSKVISEISNWRVTESESESVPYEELSTGSR